MEAFPKSCPACGEIKFTSIEVLWPGLIEAWEIDENEVAYINRQQGLYCKSCMNSLRTMALAQAILDFYDINHPLKSAYEKMKALDILEINRAGHLTQFLEVLPKHVLLEYPEIDMQNISARSGSYDLILHSDTLEHIKDPILGLSECNRVLKSGGVCIFTIPVIMNRLTRTRDGLTESFHGEGGVEQHDMKVWTEFGADMWQTVIQSGFKSCKIFAFEYPSALVMICQKE